eukprot:CAMPEP_0175071878 /NCGR_PEP_ID=MMETSP0052_2-20121109/19528_1 /TAXON_ID=51329 ORGANISM="Polytomella parva, Strain SAG 63-3" /NCGR_SAMPLE_ID=MMETSP0052_2 /ASSEMBLY_ACC=CAM_ASM_000194 /LENGTH=107 /DNA_ID=CAMNT_0016339179 /DNA_START=89 /DNA_END=412 /DNA_ORIENTATION=-
MAYNLYQVQMAKAWAQRIEKENAIAEKFWLQQANQNMKLPSSPAPYVPDDVRSVGSYRSGSVTPSNYTSKTSYLKNRLEKLEAELAVEKERRKKVEGDLAVIKTQKP